MEHQRALRFAGKNAVNAMAEFVRQGHHVSIASQIIHQRVGDGLSAGQNVRGIERAMALFFQHGRVDAAVGKEGLYNATSAWG